MRRGDRVDVVGAKLPFAGPTDRCSGFQGHRSPAGRQRRDKSLGVIAADVAAAQKHAPDPNLLAAERV